MDTKYRHLQKKKTWNLPHSTWKVRNYSHHTLSWEFLQGQRFPY